MTILIINAFAIHVDEVFIDPLLRYYSKTFAILAVNYFLQKNHVL